MLTALGFDPGTTNGSATSQSTDAIRRFQEAYGLTADGAAGPQTRAKLFEKYFLFLFPRKLEKSNFLGQGQDSNGKADYQGCGEFNPAMVFSQSVQPSGNNTTDTILSTIAEAKVITTVLPAEYGHSAGGAIVIVKKSGTNQPHGGAGLLFREGPMQHRRFMQPARFEQTGNSLHFYQPDFNLSGPVFIPKLYDGRNKSFFMVAGQYLKVRWTRLARHESK